MLLGRYDKFLGNKLMIRDSPSEQGFQMGV